jgi:hypothetical protein
MASTPTTTNGTASTVDSIIQSAIFDVALNALKTYLYAQMPWLSYPIIKQVFGAFLNWVAGYIYTYLTQVANFTVIDLQTDQEKSSYAAAVTQLQAAQSLGDPNAIQKAKDQFTSTLGNLIHFDGS